MKVLIIYTVTGPALATLERTLKVQRQQYPEYGKYDCLLVCDVSDEPPDMGFAHVKTEMYRDGKLCLAAARNLAFGWAHGQGYDAVVVGGADMVLSGFPDRLPASGFTWIPFHKGKEGEERLPEAPEFGWCAYIILSRGIYSRFRYCEEYVGYGYEDVDFQWVVLWYSGIREDTTNLRAMHLWHERRDWNSDPADLERNRELWYRRTAERHFNSGQPHPEFPPHERDGFLRVKDEVRAEIWAQAKLQASSWMYLSRGMQISGWRGDRMVGRWERLGSSPILAHIANLADDPEITWVISREPVYEADPAWTRQMVQGIAGPVLTHPDVGEQYCEVMPPNSFLVEREGGIGDLMMLVPILRQLHRMGYYVVLATDARYIPLLEQHPEIDRVIDIDDQPWPVTQYCIDLRWKVDFGGHPWSYSHHRQDLWLDIFEQEAGVQIDLPDRMLPPNEWRPPTHGSDERRPNIVLPEECRRWARNWCEAQGLNSEYVVLNVASKVSTNRSYPFMHLVADLLKRKIPVVAVHGEPWPELPDGVIDLCGTEPIERVAAVIERASVLVGPDTGGIHLAGALSVPFVALFGPIDPKTRLPIYRNFRVLRGAKQCAPCFENPHCGPQGQPRPCMYEVEPTEIADNVMGLLTETMMERRARAIRLLEPAPFARPVPLETSRAKHLTLPYCQGVGVDLGAGPDPIHARAIRVDVREQYAHIHASAACLPWFADGSLDYVYASHLLEDFADWDPILAEWARVVRPGGHIVIMVPDHERFRAAVASGQGDNLDHLHESYPGELTQHFCRMGGWTVLEDRLVSDVRNALGAMEYSILFVARKE